MHSLRPIVAGIALCTATISYSAYEFYVKVKAVAQDGRGGPVYLFVESDRTPTGGSSQEAVIRVLCAGGTLRSASWKWEATRQDEGSGDQASGKRKMLGAPKIGEATAVTSIDLPKITPKIAKEHHGRSPVPPGWEPITFSDPAAACAAAEKASAVLVKKSKSNLSTN